MFAAVTRDIIQTVLHCSLDCKIHRQWMKIWARIQVSRGSLPIHFPFLSPKTNWKSSSLLMTGPRTSNMFLALVLAACRKNHAMQERVEQMLSDKRL